MDGNIGSDYTNRHYEVPKQGSNDVRTDFIRHKDEVFDGNEGYDIEDWFNILEIWNELPVREDWEKRRILYENIRGEPRAHLLSAINESKTLLTYEDMKKLLINRFKKE